MLAGASGQPVRTPSQRTAAAVGMNQLQRRLASSIVRKAFLAQSPLVCRSADLILRSNWNPEDSHDENAWRLTTAFRCVPLSAAAGSVRCFSKKKRDDDYDPTADEELDLPLLDPDLLLIPEKPAGLLDDDDPLPTMLDPAFVPPPPAAASAPKKAARASPRTSTAASSASSSSPPLNLEVSAKKGRMWSDPWDLDDLMSHSTSTNSDDLPDWAPQYVSRASLDRVRVYPDKIPTLSALSQLSLPSPPPPHPSRSAKAYALHRKRKQYRYVQSIVAAAVPPTRIATIQSLPSWEEKQDAVDELFEQVAAELKEKEPILGKHPSFGGWVEKALEEHLRGVVAKKGPESGSSSSAGPADVSAPRYDDRNDENAVPLFMDCFVDGKDSEESAVPSIVHPLGVKTSDGGGRMVEEWELAAHKSSKRIMLRQSTREVARLMVEGDPESRSKRILLHGRQGVGKTAALAALVASARTSGCVVLYLPDGDDLRRNGYYIEPNPKNPGTFDLPVLSQQICQQLVTSHQHDLSSIAAPSDVIQAHFTADQLKQVPDAGADGMSLANLLKVGASKSALAPACYSCAVEVLMTQDKVPFWMVLDEFNCFFEPSRYFHMDYDPDVKDPIPYEQISLFRPLLQAMQVPSSLVSSDLLEWEAELAASEAPTPPAIRRGGVVAATSESRAVSRKVTDGLVERLKIMRAQSGDGTTDESAPIHLVEVPRLSPLEVEHAVANYEAVGVGKLRLDQGETITNEQEVAYLRIVSGGVAQRLMDACIL